MKIDNPVVSVSKTFTNSISSQSLQQSSIKQTYDIKKALSFTVDCQVELKSFCFCCSCYLHFSTRWLSTFGDILIPIGLSFNSNAFKTLTVNWCNSFHENFQGRLNKQRKAMARVVAVFAIICTIS